jgi:hypothetical protein
MKLRTEKKAWTRLRRRTRTHFRRNLDRADRWEITARYYPDDVNGYRAFNERAIAWGSPQSSEVPKP